MKEDGDKAEAGTRPQYTWQPTHLLLIANVKKKCMERAHASVSPLRELTGVNALPGPVPSHKN